MNAWKSALRPALAATLLLTAITGVAYPLAVWGASIALFPEEASGSLVKLDGKVVGSSLIAQSAPDSGSFHPRPSAAGSGYAGESSSGSNAGPLNRTYVDSIVPTRVAAYRAENGISASQPVPATAVTASGSGLDPDIALDDALLQVARVARVRRIDPKVLSEFVKSQAHDAAWQPGTLRPVNVLALNLALEERRVR